MTLIVYKYTAGRKVYLSTSGKWIKSARGAATYATEADAKAKALEVGGMTRPYQFRD